MHVAFRRIANRKELSIHSESSVSSKYHKTGEVEDKGVGLEEG